MNVFDACIAHAQDRQPEGQSLREFFVHGFTAFKTYRNGGSNKRATSPGGKARWGEQGEYFTVPYPNASPEVRNFSHLQNPSGCWRVSGLVNITGPSSPCTGFQRPAGDGQAMAGTPEKGRWPGYAGCGWRRLPRTLAIASGKASIACM